MSASNVSGTKRPLVAIIGATGTGKSQLAVEIATRFNGEIINADAVQMYHGLPIITNKIPAAEMKGVPHHLLGSIGLDEPTWTVEQFLPKALQTIEEIRSRSRLPILVGGTHYYIQALLFKDHILEKDVPVTAEEDFPILQESTETILAKLREVDPVIAERWHPNDRRKIQRSLQIFLQTGKPASATYLQKLESEAKGEERLRCPTLILWPFADREVHVARLDLRVDSMLKNGLLAEVGEVASHLRSRQEKGEIVDRTKGIWQSIGFRQFEAYQNALDSGASESELEKLKTAGILDTQAATRRYARQQSKWIRIQLLNALHRADALKNTFLLDGSDLTQWNDTVITSALDLTQKFLNGENLPEPTDFSPEAKEYLTPKAKDQTHNPEAWVKHICETCGTTAVTPKAWEIHLKSRGHRVALSRKKARETKDLVVLEDKYEEQAHVDLSGFDQFGASH